MNALRLLKYLIFIVEEGIEEYVDKLMISLTKGMQLN